MCGRWREAGHGTHYLQHHQHDELTPEDKGSRESREERRERGEKGGKEEWQGGRMEEVAGEGREKAGVARRREEREEEEDRHKAIEGRKEKKEQLGKIFYAAMFHGNLK